MGMESFYINLLALDSKYKVKKGNHFFTGSKQHKSDEILSFLKEKGFTLELEDNNKYSVDDLFYLEIISHKKFFQGISIEGCFSCYDKVLKKIVQFVDFVNFNFAPLKIYSCANDFSGNKYALYTKQNDLVDYINSKNEAKRISFEKVYPFCFDSLPGKTFYQKIKYVKFLNFFMSKVKVNEQ